MVGGRMKILRRIRQLIELPILEVKWFITRRFRVFDVRGRDKKTTVEMVEKLHLAALEAERLGRPEVHQRAIGALRALQWWCGTTEDLNVEN